MLAASEMPGKRFGRIGRDCHALRPVALAVEPHPRAPVIQVAVLDVQSERLAYPRSGQQQQTAQGVRLRVHVARLGQEGHGLVACEVCSVGMAVEPRSAHVLAGVGVDVPLLAEVAVEAAHDAQIPAHRVFRRWPHAAVIGGEHLDMGALRPQHVDAII